MVGTYAKDNGINLVVDSSKPWPEWPVLWANPLIDITKAIVDIYNRQSGTRPVSLGPRKDPGPSISPGTTRIFETTNLGTNRVGLGSDSSTRR